MAELDFGWGGGGWGEGAWGVAEADLTMISAHAVRENVVRMTFSAVPLYTLLDNARDASRLDHYSILAVSGVSQEGEPVRPVRPVLVEEAAQGGTALDLTVDRPFTGWPAVYRISAIGLVSTEGAYLLPGASYTFYGLRQGEAPIGSADALVAGRDISNPQSLRDLTGMAAGDELALGTYQIGPDGDYANDLAFASWRKRCIRRVMTRYQGFAHLRNYGAGVNDRVKRQFTSREREMLCELAQQQIRLEPETLSVTVVTQALSSGVVVLQVRALTSLKPDAVEFTIPVS